MVRAHRHGNRQHWKVGELLIHGLTVRHFFEKDLIVGNHADGYRLRAVVDGPGMKDTLAERRRLRDLLIDRGWKVELVPWCEDAETPGPQGSINGVIVVDRRAIKVRVRFRSLEQINDTLSRALGHVDPVRAGDGKPPIDMRRGKQLQEVL